MKTKFFSIVFLLSFFCLTAQAQDAATRKKQFNLDDNIAIGGYDPVAYFKDHRAIKGKREYSVDQLGVTYFFSSYANREEFKKNPSQYEPEYGGWCAYAMGAKNEKVSINPETFKIINGKLYLFYNKNSNNTLLTWNNDETNLKSKADINWKKRFK